MCHVPSILSHDSSRKAKNKERRERKKPCTNDRPWQIMASLVTCISIVPRLNICKFDLFGCLVQVPIVQLYVQLELGWLETQESPVSRAPSSADANHVNARSQYTYKSTFFAQATKQYNVSNEPGLMYAKIQTLAPAAMQPGSAHPG